MSADSRAGTLLQGGCPHREVAPAFVGASPARERAAGAGEVGAVFSADSHAGTLPQGGCRIPSRRGRNSIPSPSNPIFARTDIEEIAQPAAQGEQGQAVSGQTGPGHKGERSACRERCRFSTRASCTGAKRTRHSWSKSRRFPAAWPMARAIRRPLPTGSG
jgi:hypothetical protein